MALNPGKMNRNERLLEKQLSAAKQALIVKEKLFEAIIEKNIDMVTLASPDGKIIYSSPALTDVLGYSAEEIANTPAFELIHPDDYNGLMECVKDVVETPGKSFCRVQRLLKKDGAWIWCEGTITNMLNVKGINALVSNFRDI